MNFTNNIIVLFNGYSYMSKQKENVMNANCTCTLIKGHNKNIIVDTLTSWDKDNLTSELLKNNIKPENVDFVICTHSHSDHMGNNNLFLNAKHIIGQSISFKDEYFLHDFKNSYKIDENIIVVATPGHTLQCISVIVKNAQTLTSKPFSTFAIAGDLFENSNDIYDESIWIEAGSESPNLQRKHRFEMSNIADYIIPGHGEMFQVTETIRNKLKNDMEEIK